MKIAFFETEDWEKEFLKKKFKKHKLYFSKNDLDEKNASSVKDFDIISVFIYSQINKHVLDKLDSVKLIVTRSTGFDHIDINECKKRNVKVLNVPFYGENTVAEHAFALILNLSRKIHKSCERTEEGDFSLKGLRGFDLKGKTLGIVGMGHIGEHVARMAKGFEMNILAFDIYKKSSLAKKFGFKYATLKELLKNSDIVTLHTPYNKHTHHLINSRNIGLMKKGAYLINTARGGLVDTGPLIRALKSKHLAGAGLDVLEEEELIKEEAQLVSKKFSNEKMQCLFENHKLLKMENVVVTPHNAFNSQEALQRILDTTANNIQYFIEKNKFLNEVKI